MCLIWLDLPYKDVEFALMLRTISFFKKKKGQCFRCFDRSGNENYFPSQKKDKIIVKENTYLLQKSKAFFRYQ